jgi:predicted nucleotidyltransferase
MTKVQGGTALAEGRLRADLDEVRRIVLQGLGMHRARVWLFGSRARGTGGRASDIDVAILPLEPLPTSTLARIEEALERSLVLSPVELVDLSSADPALRERVEREGLPWKS